VKAPVILPEFSSLKSSKLKKFKSVMGFKNLALASEKSSCSYAKPGVNYSAKFVSERYGCNSCK